MELVARVPSMVKSPGESRKLSSVACRVSSFSRRLWLQRVPRARVTPCFQPLCAATAARNSRQTMTKKKLAEAPCLYHRVEEGDTLFSIARQYNTTMRSIAVANDVADIDMLRAGQLLLVPILPGGFSRVRAVITEVREPLTQSARAATAGAGWRKQAAPVLGIARFAIPVFLLAPIMGFCVRCIVDKLRAGAEASAHEKLAAEAKWKAFHRDQLRGWKGRMTQLKASEPPSLALACGVEVEAEEESELEDKQEEEVELSSQDNEEELYESYAELEASYKKFLVDSGLAESGHRQHSSTR